MLPARLIHPGPARSRLKQPEAPCHPPPAFVPPPHAPRLASHSTAVSHLLLPQPQENSSAPAHRSCRLSTIAQLLEKFRNQIASHGRSVFRVRSNVVNRLDRSHNRSSCQMYKLRIDRPPVHDAFHFRQANRNRRHTPERNTNVINRVSSRAVSKSSQPGHTNFRDRLSVAGSHLPRIMKIPRKASPNANRSNQLV